MDKLNVISIKIEILRQKMYKTIEESKDTQCDKVLILSQELDNLLVKYHRLK